MRPGTLSAVSGMVAASAVLDLLAQEVAAMGVPGWRPPRSSVSVAAQAQAMGHAGGVTWPVGPLGALPRLYEAPPILDQPARLRTTGRALDVALEGPGTLVLQAPDGPRYTRDGRLALRPDGVLVHASGLPVLGADGLPIRVRPDGPEPRIERDGRVVQGETAVGRLAVVIPSAGFLVRAGDGMWAVLPGAPQATPVQDARISPGHLEDSGTDPLRVTVEALRAARWYESSMRALSALDAALRLAIERMGAGGKA